MNMSGLRASVVHAWDHYGMAGVLVLLCAYYSWATWQERHPVGRAAADSVVARLQSAPPGERSVLIVARTVEEDSVFATVLTERLQASGFEIVATVQGEPRDARQALQQQADAGRPLHWIATTPECAAWTVFEGLKEKFPALGQPRLLVPTSYRWATFLQRDNLLNVANQIAVVAILAIGMTMVILTGGIDLSVGSLIALAAVVTTLGIRDFGGGVEAGPLALVLCSLGGILACALSGLFSGVMITVFRIPPFIATLAVMQVASGLAYILSRGGSIYEVPDSFTWLGRGTGLFGIPHAVVLMLVLYLAAHALMARTVFGRHIYAVGSNVETARLCGVNVPRVLLAAYTLCGALAGLGGVVLTSQLKTGAPTYGLANELYVIAAVVVGGTSLSGGSGRIFGTLIGAFIIGVINNGMNLTGVQSYTQKVVLGLVILGAVLLDLLKKRTGRAQG